MSRELVPREARFWIGVSSTVVFSAVVLLALLNEFNWWQATFFGVGVTVFFVSLSLAIAILMCINKERLEN